MQKYGLLFLILISIVGLNSCANKVAPTGGDKDQEAPKLLKSNPQNLSTNFNASEISLTFDEYITLSDPQSQIFISPLLKSKPEIILSNKSIEIKIKDSLAANTTYTIHFGNSIKDVNEGNVLENFQYVFSTGRYIDSLRISGFIKSVYDNKPVKSATVMLYKSKDDSSIVKHKPDYFIKTDETGYFQINHLKEGNYKLVSILDANNNYLYEPDELIAFSDTIINVKDTSIIYQLLLFKGSTEKNKLLKSSSAGTGKIKLAFINRVDSININLLNPQSEIRSYSINTERDSIIFYINPVIKDSIRASIIYDDIVDTFTVKLKSERTKKDSSLIKNKLIITPNFINSKSENTLSYNYSIQLKFSSPIKSFDKNLIQLISNSDSTITNTEVELSNNKYNHQQYFEINSKLKSNKKYTLNIPKESFTDYDGNTNDSIKIIFRYAEAEEAGNLKIKIIGLDSSHHYIYQLLNDKKEIVMEEKISSDIKDLLIKYLLPAKYSFIIIDDINANGYWDTGNYWNHKQPERKYPYQGEINIRSNWDLSIEININSKIKLKK